VWLWPPPYGERNVLLGLGLEYIRGLVGPLGVYGMGWVTAHRTYSRILELEYRKDKKFKLQNHESLFLNSQNHLNYLLNLDLSGSGDDFITFLVNMKIH